MTSIDRMEKTQLPQICLYLRESEGKGRGVFAGEFIKAHTLIAVCPVLLFPAPPSDNSGNGISCEREVLNSYTYTWDMNTQALSLGLGSMFNHTRVQNVGFTIDKERHLIRYVTLCDVRVDTELCINYGPKLWFDDSEGGMEAQGQGQGYSTDSSDEEGDTFLSRMEL